MASGGFLLGTLVVGEREREKMCACVVNIALRCIFLDESEHEITYLVFAG